MLELEQKEELIVEILVNCFERYEYGSETLNEIIMLGSESIFNLFARTTSESS